MRHSANINISERPPKFYQDISNDNLFTQEVVFRTSNIGDILQEGEREVAKYSFLEAQQLKITGRQNPLGGFTL